MTAWEWLVLASVIVVLAALFVAFCDLVDWAIDWAFAGARAWRNREV